MTLKLTPANAWLVSKSVVKMIVDKQLDLKNKIKYVLGFKIIEFRIGSNIVLNIHRKALRAFAPFVSLDQASIDEMQSFIKLTSGMHCLIDVGALYGIFSLVFTCNNKSAIAYAIEPSTQPFEMLKEHIAINPSCGKIKSFQFALGDTEGKLKMKYQWQHLVAIGEHEQTKDCVEVKVTRLDDFIKSNKIVPDAIKIDTEGYEYAILKGGEKYFQHHKPIIFLEVHPKLLASHNIKTLQLIDLIHSMGFKIYDSKGKLLNSPELFISKHLACRVICSKKLVLCHR